MRIRDATRILAAGACASALLCPAAWAMGAQRRAELRDEVRSMFHHGYTGYMAHAYPADELRPLSCSPLWRDPDPRNIGVNDIHANVSMTLVDSLSALLLILPEEWPAAVERVAANVSFDQDVKVQVFELTIRALGALLSTHQRLERLPDGPAAQAADLGLADPVDVKRHSARMLDLATDLARRLLPAFSSPTGIPYARVNLRRGVEKGESHETCSAGAGSLILEFTLLSRLTGDPIYETLAHRAFMAIWNRRTDHDLVGNQIEIMQGRWLPPGVSGIHAGIDSFFEYALKAAIMMDDSSYMDIFNDAYAAIQTHVRTDDGFIYRPVYLRGLQATSPSYVDSLSAFFPGVMVLAGDLESAVRGHLLFWNIWRRYDAMPESWDSGARSVGWGGWPGRPEFIESTYYLHRATGDDFYLRVGERVLKDILRRTLTSCGFARLSDVEKGTVDDRMESFMLSETLKYLYLLFDTSETPLSNTVFTTEGHPLSLPINSVPPTPAWHASHRREDLYCPVYVPPTIGGLPVGIEGRADYDYVRALVFGPGDAGLKAEQNLYAWGDGTCAAYPAVPKNTIELVLVPADTPPDAPLPPHDAAPSSSKVFQTETGDWVIADIDGLRVTVRWRLDGDGYDVVSIGPHRVRHGQSVTITDKRMDGYLPAPAPVAPYGLSHLHLSISPYAKPHEALLSIEASTALFGLSFQPVPSAASSHGSDPAQQLPRDGWYLDTSVLLAIPTDPQGCSAIRQLTPVPRGRPFVLLVDRGGCTFMDKAQRAAAAGAIGLLVANHREEGDHPIRPSADPQPAALRSVAHVGIAVVPHSVGALVRGVLAAGAEADPEAPFLAVRVRDPDKAAAVAAAAPGGRPTDEGRREGRLVVGDHEIVNMRVVEP